MSDSHAQEWYFCLKHHRVEPYQGCKAADRLGPYASEAEAERALQTVAERNDRWDEEDRKSVASLIVSAMMTATETLLEAPPDDAARQAAVVREAEKQIRLIVLAIPHITPSDLADGPG